jgi:hypothetical protein
MKRLLPFFLILSGCRDAGLSEGNSDTAWLPEFDGSTPFLRVDVHASAAGAGDLLDQSFLLTDGVDEHLSLSLATPIKLTGTVTGLVGTPYPSDVDVPGAEGPVEAVVLARVPGTLMSYAVSTDADGSFSMRIVPASGYEMATVPSANPNLPFLIESGSTFTEDTNLQIRLGWENSLPVYGQVLDASGVAVQNVPVRLVEPVTRIAGPTVYTDTWGVFNLRAHPGDYTLEIIGDPHRALPMLTRQISLFGDAAEGLLIPVTQYQNIDQATVSGEITGPSGYPSSSVVVRLRSEEVFGMPNAEMVAETTTGSNGRFSIRVAPGKYSVEFIPPHEGQNSPLALDEAVSLEAGFVELPAVVLRERPTVQARVLDAEGRPLAGALVRARELAFNGDTFEVYTNAAGEFKLDVSESFLQWTLIPTSPFDGAITNFDAWPQDLDGGNLALEEGVPLSGCTGWQGEAVPFVLIEVRDRLGALYGSALTDEKGCFRMRVDWDESGDTGF